MRPSGTRASGSKRRPGRPFQGRAHARGMLVEATWVAAKITSPLRAFFERVRARRGMQIAIVASLTEKKLRARVSAPPSSPTGRRKPPPQERARVPPLGSGS